MILYTLRCANSHQFESWFRNSAGYDALAAAGEIACPVCGGRDVAKAPMAPHIARAVTPRPTDTAPQETAPVVAAPPGTGDEAPPSPATGTAMDAAMGGDAPAAIRQALGELRRQVEANCDYVGDRFAEEARRIHYNEAKPRSIYGEASPAETEALQDEGVTFRRIPWLARTDS